MLRAGTAVARLALALAPHARQRLIYAGPGNNGGDGLVAARLLHEAGHGVVVELHADAARLPGDAAWALQAAVAAGVEVRLPSSELVNDSPELVIDALLGLGNSRAIEGDLAQAVLRINTCAAPVLAVDIPSGLAADTGTPLGAAVVRADHTLSLLTLKPGLFTAAGRDHAGQVWLDDLGVLAPSDAACATLTGRHDMQAAWSLRRHASHKGSYGDVAVVGGAAGMAGAAWLAAQAALAAGAGRVYCSLLDANASGMPANRPELMTRTAWWREPPAVLAASTVVCGCGGGDAVRAALPTLLHHAARLVLDADALNAMAGDSDLRRLLTARSARGQPTVITPHPLEAARLLGCEASVVQSHRLHAAQQLAQELACVVVLKGSGTVIAAPGQRPTINYSGNGSLASAGTGDVLAGWIGGSWSALHGAGLAQAEWQAARRATLASVALHGHAADVHARQCNARLPLRALDLIEAMRQALRRDMRQSVHEPMPEPMPER